MPLITDLRASRDAVTRVVVYDHEGIVRGTEFPREIGRDVSDVLDAAAGPSPQSAVEVTAQRDGALQVWCPVRSQHGEVLGQVAMTASLAGVEAAMDESLRRGWMVTLILVGLGALLTYLMIHGALRPLSRIRAGLARIGRGELDEPIGLSSRTELGLLATSIDDMASALRSAQDERIEQERLHREMELARDIQHSLLSLGERRFGNLDVFCAYHPAMEVGGDYCDVFEIDADRFAVVIADVAGKGLGGCLVTAMLSVGLRSLRFDHDSPRRALIDLERLLSPTLAPGTFVTAFLGIVHRSTGRISFASAAHNPLLVLRANGATEWIYTKGIPLGAVSAAAFAATVTDDDVVLDAGDLLVQTTDGVTEAVSRRDGEQLGVERLEAEARRGAGESVAAMAARIGRLVSDWRGDGGEIDDETLLVLAHRASSERVNRWADVDRAAVAQLQTVMADRAHLELSADLEELERLPAWMESCTDLDGLSRRDRHLVHQALYEVCANVIEHGYGLDPSRRFDLWRIPVGPSVASGYFMIRDEGVQYDPSQWTATHFDDARARTRGRGIGRDILAKSMESIIHLMGTPTGNVTFLRYDPSKHQEEGVSS